MSPPSAEESGHDETETVFCRDCGERISARAEICPECGVRQLPPPTSSADSAFDDLLEGGNPFVAAALSALFPGLGQIYNRELEKGIAFIVGGFLAVLSALAIIGFVLYPAIWIYSIYEAYKTAEGQATEAATVGYSRGKDGTTRDDEDNETGRDR